MPGFPEAVKFVAAQGVEHCEEHAKNAGFAHYFLRERS